MTITANQIDALTSNGYSVKEWTGRDGTRYYLRDSSGKEVGFLVDSDASGSTGTCGAVTRRAGFIKSVLRGER